MQLQLNTWAVNSHMLERFVDLALLLDSVVCDVVVAHGWIKPLRDLDGFER